MTDAEIDALEEGDTLDVAVWVVLGATEFEFDELLNRHYMRWPGDVGRSLVPAVSTDWGDAMGLVERCLRRAEPILIHLTVHAVDDWRVSAYEDRPASRCALGVVWAETGQVAIARVVLKAVLAQQETQK